MKVYAIHTSGKKLYFPTDEALRCSLIPRSNIAAITIDQNGVTYPAGTFYLLGKDGKPKAGWHRVDDHLKNAENGHNSQGCIHEIGSGATKKTGVGGEYHVAS